MSVDSHEEAERRYRLACERLEAVRAAWEADGSPMMCPGSHGGLIAHPLLRELRAHELLVDKLESRVRPRRAGRPPSAVMGVELPPARMRRVK